MRIARAVVAIALVLCAVALPAVAEAAPAPPFALELFDGQTLRLADLKGKAVILLFWAQW